MPSGPITVVCKLLRYDMDMAKIYDLVALRIILKTVPDCYAALGSIHNIWPPLPGRIKDYIAMPKATNYRSLHTTVIGPEGKNIEIQLRTQEMHEESEYGIATHWLYKERRAAVAERGRWSKKLAGALEWIRELGEWQERYRHAKKEPDKFLDSFKTEFFKDRIFAITPRGDVIDLPAGSTPVDFAYHIHTEIGNTCAGAKVNQAFTPLNHVLQSGDMVEILTQKNKRPSEDWLKFAKTSAAREHIKAALREKVERFRGKRSPSKTELRIAVLDRIGLLKDITSAIAGSHINILDLHTVNNPGGRFPINKIVCAVSDRIKIEKLILKLKKIKEIKEVSYRLI